MTLGFVDLLRRALLGEIEGTCITRAKFGSVLHEYSTIAGKSKQPFRKSKQPFRRRPRIGPGD